MNVPDYSWFDQAPSHYKTRNQLAALGLKPGGPIVATVTWKRGQRYAYLFDQNTAVPKRQLSEAQQTALKSPGGRRPEGAHVRSLRQAQSLPTRAV